MPFPLRPGGVKDYCEWKEENKRPSDQKHFNAIKEIRNNHRIDISKYFKKYSKKIEWPNYRDKLKERAKIYRELKGDANIAFRLINTFLNIEFKGLLGELDEKLWEQCKKNPDNDVLKLATLIWFANGNLSDDGTIPDGKRPTLLLDMLASDGSSSQPIKNIKVKYRLYCLSTKLQEKQGHAP